MYISDLFSKLRPGKKNAEVTVQDDLMRPRVNRGGAVVAGAEADMHSSSDETDESGKLDCYLSFLLTGV